MDLTGLGSLFDFGSKLIDKLLPDPAQKAQAALELSKLQQSGELAKLASDTDLAKGQLDINKVEAASTNWFIAGWRPAVGWVGVFALAYAAILNPVGQFAAEVIWNYKGAFPVIDTTVTMQLLFGLLGLGAYRTIEKVKGAEGNR
jgi:hypothetical protein